MYLDRVTGSERIQVRTMTDVIAARFDGAEVVLRLRDRGSGAEEELRCDAVLLGTGFSAEPPALVRALMAELDLSELAVTRAYRLALPTPESTATCYLQGINEATHGISDSLLSVLAVRAGEIVADLLDRRRDHGGAELLAGAPAQYRRAGAAVATMPAKSVQEGGVHDEHGV
jgi:L-ornithine N5-oxygenase